MAEKCGVAVCTTYEWSNPKSKYFDPDFPRSFSMSEKGRAEFFVEEEVDNFLVKKAAARRELGQDEQVQPRRAGRRKAIKTATTADSR